MMTILTFVRRLIADGLVVDRHDGLDVLLVDNHGFVLVKDFVSDIGVVGNRVHVQSNCSCVSVRSSLVHVFESGLVRVCHIVCVRICNRRLGDGIDLTIRRIAKMNGLVLVVCTSVIDPICKTN